MTALKMAASAALAVVFLFPVSHVSYAAELQVFELELNETMGSLGDRLATTRAQHERLGTGSSIRGFVATIAGTDTGRVVVIVEYESAAAREAGQALVQADDATAAMMAARQAAGNTLVSNTRWTELSGSGD